MKRIEVVMKVNGQLRSGGNFFIESDTDLPNDLVNEVTGLAAPVLESPASNMVNVSAQLLGDGAVMKDLTEPMSVAEASLVEKNFIVALGTLNASHPG